MVNGELTMENGELTMENGEWRIIILLYYICKITL